MAASNQARPYIAILVDRAHGGEEVIVAKAGKPWARLVPLETQPERIPGRYHDGPGPTFSDPLPDDELKAWEA